MESSLKSCFFSHHRVQFYETDLMGIVHHSNYLRFMEEGRVEWAHSHGLIDYQRPMSAAHFAVLETQFKHLKPARFGDDLLIYVQAKRSGFARIQFQYQIHRKSENASQLLGLGRSLHVALDSELRPIKIPTQMKLILEKQLWTETWLSSLSE